MLEDFAATIALLRRLPGFHYGAENGVEIELSNDEASLWFHRADGEPVTAEQIDEAMKEALHKNG